MLSLKRVPVSTDVGFYRLSITLIDQYHQSKLYEIAVEVLDEQGRSIFEIDPAIKEESESDKQTDLDKANEFILNDTAEIVIEAVNSNMRSEQVDAA